MMVWAGPRCSVFKTKFHLWISTHETNVLNLPFLLNLVLKKPETHPDIILSSLNLNLLLFEEGENTFCIQCYFPHVWGVSVDARKNSGDKAIQSWERVDGNKVWGLGFFLFVCLIVGILPPHKSWKSGLTVSIGPWNCPPTELSGLQPWIVCLDNKGVNVF